MRRCLTPLVVACTVISPPKERIVRYIMFFPYKWKSLYYIYTKLKKKALIFVLAKDNKKLA